MKERKPKKSTMVGFGGGIDDLDSMASVGREGAGEDHEMSADLTSVRNSMECASEVDPIIVRDLELSITGNDNVITLTGFGNEDILTMFNRIIKQLNTAVEMKAV